MSLNRKIIVSAFDTVARIWLVTGVLFILLNFGAAMSPWPESVTPMDPPVDMALLRKAYGTNDESLIAKYRATPGTRLHTVLSYTEGLSRPYYTIGIEGIRYQPGWTDVFMEWKLREDRRHVFLFGGSTVFGHGVLDGQDLATAMAAHLEDALVINFAVQSHDHMRESQKLVYLLQKGYRPKTVVFVDGLNDISTFGSSSYESFDKPRSRQFLLAHSDIPFLDESPLRDLKVFARALPVLKVYRNLRHRNQYAQESERPLSANMAVVDLEKIQGEYGNWLAGRLPRGSEDRCAQELIDFYIKIHAFHHCRPA